MKKLLYIYLAFVLLFSCDNKKNNLYYLNIKGEVKSVHITSFVAIEKFGEIESGDKGWENEWENDAKLYFNDKGNTVEQKGYDGDGELINLYKNKYDDKNTAIEECMTKYGIDIGDDKNIKQEKTDEEKEMERYMQMYGINFDNANISKTNSGFTPVNAMSRSTSTNDTQFKQSIALISINQFKS